MLITKKLIEEFSQRLNISKYGKQSLILKLFRKHEEMFDGTLGNYKCSEYNVELLEGVKPYHAKRKYTK